MQDLNYRNGDLAEVVKALNERKTLTDDLVVPAGQMLIDPRDGALVTIEGGEDGMPIFDTNYDLTNLAHGQLAGMLDIPVAYWRRLQDGHLDLLAENANHWFQLDERRFLLRTLRDPDGGNGLVRAVLSNSYQVVDDLDVLLSVLAGINAAGIEAAAKVDITPTKMHAYIETPGITVNAPELLKAYRDPRTGRTGTDYPIVSAGILVSNSETGGGALTLSPRIVFQVCKNGMTRPADAIRQIHLGGRLEEGRVNWSNETHTKNLDLIMAKTRDAVATFLDKPYLERVIRELQPLAATELSDVKAAIEHVSKACTFTADQQADILSAFIKGGDTSALGITQAITYVAQEQTDGDTAAFLEGQALKAGELAMAVR